MIPELGSTCYEDDNYGLEIVNDQLGIWVDQTNDNACAAQFLYLESDMEEPSDPVDDEAVEELLVCSSQGDHSQRVQPSR